LRMSSPRGIGILGGLHVMLNDEHSELSDCPCCIACSLQTCGILFKYLPFCAKEGATVCEKLITRLKRLCTESRKTSNERKYLFIDRICSRCKSI
jgi:hypothetical protein